MSIGKWIVGLCAPALLALQPGMAWAGGPTHEAVKKRGQLICGVNNKLPPFSYLNEKNERVGADTDFCRAVAAAVLGDAGKVKYVTLPIAKRFEALKSGEIDLLARHSVVSMDRTVGTGVRAAAITFIDGQAFVVPRALNAANLAGLTQKSICVVKDSAHEAKTRAWFQAVGLPATLMPFDNPDAMYAAFFEGKCDGVTQESTILAQTVIMSGKAANYLMLPNIISREPIGPYVRAGDDGWFDIVKWTHNAMVEAEERGISQVSADEGLKSKDPDVSALLGTTPGSGKLLGLDDKWVYNVVKQVGNYGEVYDRNFGSGSPLKFARGINDLAARGGVMFALPKKF
jgi:general L-amino acid transport system substrate-binding protein